ncbi:hypothetical protein EVAR_30935_1 [Eumeta japonica]|uniref:Uncharacterized protein n=1 Tax=Eumeta variegata TaxID=151549 RepID=A0A4C1V534_EUMVA|nr:hypothetical protein EVAR_30935_1 [Eumeta japonica]
MPDAARVCIMCAAWGCKRLTLRDFLFSKIAPPVVVGAAACGKKRPTKGMEINDCPLKRDERPMLCSRSTIIASPYAAERHARVLTRVTCTVDDDLRESSRHRMSLETVTGRLHSSCLARKRPGGVRDLKSGT